MLKRALRLVCAVLAIAAALVVLGALAPRPLWPVSGGEGAVTRRILLLSSPIHTDIAIPLDTDVLARFAMLARDGVPAELPGARYLVFGWGSRAFYINTPTWSELKPAPVLAALTVDDAVMHVEVAGDIAEPQASVTGFDLDATQFDALLDFIAQSFRQGSGGPIRVAGAAYGPYDAFFEANGRFNALVGCNTWTARALRQAGLRTGWWNPLPQSLALSVRLYN